MTNETTSTAFRVALDKKPVFMMGFDSLSHTTLKDLHWLTIHEVDLYDEGEESDIRSAADLKAVLAWRKYLEREIAKTKSK
jgi:hypothetical protein